ncbi:MAG: HAD family hydrolase [Phycisphaerales bacterium]
MPRHYDLIAVDLDGTLLGPDGSVSAPNAASIAEARAAGVRVAICTGRGLVECDPILKRVDQRDPVVVAGGSMTACPVNRSTLHRFTLDPALVARATNRLLSHGHPVMVLKDPAATGYDYLMVVGEEEHPLDPVTAWWFEQMGVTVRYVHHVTQDEHPEHTVRLGVCGLSGAMRSIEADMLGAFGDSASMHHFPAVVAPDHAKRLPDGQTLHILEVFSAAASKWSAIRWLADREGIEPARIAAIGDQINDLPMIAGAGLGIAMDNAVARVKAAAKRHTRSNAEDGVAHAVRKILDGAW